MKAVLKKTIDDWTSYGFPVIKKGTVVTVKRVEPETRSLISSDYVASAIINNELVKFLIDRKDFEGVQ